MDGYVTIGTELDTKLIEKQIALLEDKLEGLVEEYEILEKLEPFEGQNRELIKLGNEIDSTRKKIQHLKQEQTTDFSGITKGITGIIGKIGKWSLALLGIRTVYSFIRNAVNQVVQEDQTMANQIKYINYAIGTALKPVLEFILNIIYKIIAGIGAIIKLITGVNIFAKATAKNFANANKSAGELRKTIAGFDEMDIIGGTGGTGLLGDIGADLGNLRDLSVEVETLSEKIKNAFKLPTKDELEKNTQPFRDFWNKIGEFLDKNVLSDWKELFNEFVENTKPVWQPIADSFKQAFGPLYNYANENFIQPLGEKLNSFKDRFLSKYASFINKIIYFINMAFGVFGVNIDYIEEESNNAGKEIEKNLGKAFDETAKKEEKTYTWLDKLYNKYVELTNKNWKINTDVVVNGGGLKEWYNNKFRGLLKDKTGISLPKLAKGGIVNMPSRGVPVGGAIAGERGAEGVIPLTNSQQMALLGEAIGKYITINATVINKMNGRVISKELQEVKAENDFATNR